MWFLVFLMDCVLSWLESRFPMLPTPRPAISSKTGELLRPDGGLWRAAEDYYFLEDRSPRLWQRIEALFEGDYDAVSFWRKRGYYLKNPSRVFLEHDDPDQIGAEW